MIYAFRKNSCGKFIVPVTSLLTSFPWHFHVSTSGLEVPNTYFHGGERMASVKNFIAVAMAFIPILFMVEFLIVSTHFTDLPNSIQTVISHCVYYSIVIAIIASLLYYRCCYPANRGVQVGVETGVVNVAPINPDE